MRHQLPVYSPLPFAAIVQGVRSGFSPRGARERLRHRIQELYQPLECILTDSGTGALTLGMLAALETHASSAPVIALPAYGCFDLATALIGAGARGTFYDLERATLGPDWLSLEAALVDRVDAVVVVHQYGLPVDIGRVRELLRASANPRALLVEDAAQGMGGRIGAVPLGALGDLGVLSFGRGKGRTGGQGGALLAMTADGVDAVSRIQDRLQPAQSGFGGLVSLVGQWLLARPSIYGVPARVPALGLGETPFHSPHSIHDLSHVAAGVLDVTWGVSKQEADRRHQVVARWGELLAGQDRVACPTVLRDAQAGWLRFPVIASDDVAEGSLRSVKAKRAGVMPGYPQALLELPGVDQMSVTSGPPIGEAQSFSHRLFTLPTHSLVREEDYRATLEVLA